MIRCFAPLGAIQERNICDAYQRLADRSEPSFSSLALELENSGARGVHFSPHTLSPADQRLILGGVVHQKLEKGEAALRLQGKILTGKARQFWKDGGK